MNRNSILTLLEEQFWEDIENFTMECVDEFSTDELAMIFTEYLVDYARLDMIENLKIADAEVEQEEDVEIVSGELQL